MDKKASAVLTCPACNGFLSRPVVRPGRFDADHKRSTSQVIDARLLVERSPDEAGVGGSIQNLNVSCAWNVLGATKCVPLKVDRKL